MERAQPSCLHKPSSVRTITEGPLCGNALLDPGEECDCGTVELKITQKANAVSCCRLVLFEIVESLKISVGEGRYHLGFSTGVVSCEWGLIKGKVLVSQSWSLASNS